MSEWIKCSDRLPENDEEVLVFGKDGMFCGRYETCAGISYWNSHRWDHTECMVEFEPVTHWMPFPNPPEKP